MRLDLGYIPLPQSVVELGKAAVAQIDVDTGAAEPASVAPDKTVVVPDRTHVVPDNAPIVPDKAAASPTLAAPVAPTTTPPAHPDSYTVGARESLRSIAAKLYTTKSMARHSGRKSRPRSSPIAFRSDPQASRTRWREPDAPIDRPTPRPFRLDPCPARFRGMGAKVAIASPLSIGCVDHSIKSFSDWSQFAPIPLT